MGQDQEWRVCEGCARREEGGERSKAGCSSLRSPEDLGSAVVHRRHLREIQRFFCHPDRLRTWSANQSTVGPSGAGCEPGSVSGCALAALAAVAVEVLLLLLLLAKRCTGADRGVVAGVAAAGALGA